MDTHLYLAFVATVAVLACIPGPNMALIVGNSVAFGTRTGLLTVVGTTSAVVPQLALVALGMSAALATLGAWFDALRWLGAAYLVWLGIAQWRSAPVDLAAVRPAPPSLRRSWTRAFLVSLTNPKTLLFFGAFFPQFVDATRPLALQLALLSVTYLAVIFGIDCVWAVVAGRARRAIAGRGRMMNRVSGGCLVGAGLALAAARRP